MVTQVESWRAHLRTAILRVLERSPGRSANDSVIKDAVHGLGFGATRDQVRTELGWLADQGLVTVEQLTSLTVATITEAGEEVATGMRTVDGVKRPSAG